MYSAINKQTGQQVAIKVIDKKKLKPWSINNIK